jgi:hypothetical protein
MEWRFLELHDLQRILLEHQPAIFVVAAIYIVGRFVLAWACRRFRHLSTRAQRHRELAFLRINTRVVRAAHADRSEPRQTANRDRNGATGQGGNDTPTPRPANRFSATRSPLHIGDAIALAIADLRPFAPSLISNELGIGMTPTTGVNSAANGGQSVCNSVGGRAHVAACETSIPDHSSAAHVHPVHGVVHTAPEGLSTVPAADEVPAAASFATEGADDHG